MYKEGIVCDGIRAIVEISQFRNFDPKDWEFGRYKELLDLARRNACYEEVRDKHPDVDAELYEVYRKIATGTTANLSKGAGTFVDACRGRVAQRKQRMRDMAERGMSIREIAIETGWSEKTVREAVYGDARGVK